MKIKFKGILVILFLLVCSINVNVYAAGSFSVSTNKTSLNVDGTATITVTTSNCAGKFSVSSSNASVAAVSTKAIFVDGTNTFTVTAKESGTATITVKPEDVSDTDLNDITGSKSVKIKVVAPETPKKEEQTTKPTTTTTTKPSSTTTTTTNKNNTTTSTTNKNNTSNKNTTTTKKKSTNADLVGLTVNVEGLSPKFDKDKTSYTLKVGSDVEKLRLGISLDDSRATYRVTGNKNFKTGENIVKIIVTAEDAKTTKTYKIVVDKEPDLTLESLVVENAELTKEFDAGVLEYTLKDIDEDVKSLKINAVAKSEEVLVNIEGNDKLVAGENTVKVIVSTEDGKYSKTYTLKVNKKEAVPTISENVEEEIVEENSLLDGIFGENEEKTKQNITIIALYLLAMVEFVQVIYLYKKLREANPDYERITLNKEKQEKEYQRRKVDIEIEDSQNLEEN